MYVCMCVCVYMHDGRETEREGAGLDNQMITEIGAIYFDRAMHGLDLHHNINYY